MKEQPYISIITVCFNSSKTIKSCIASVKNQSYKSIEHVFIDGDSTDGTQKIIKDSEPTFFTSEPDTGIYNAMNKGLKGAKGEYCLFLNADDAFAHEKVIEKMAECISGLDLICAGIDIYKGDKRYRSYKATSFKPWMFIFGHQPPHPGFCIRTKLLQQVGGFNENYKIAGDFDAMLRLFSLPNLKWKSIPLVAVHMQHGGASSGSFAKKRKMNTEIKISLKENNKTAWSLFIWAKYLFKVFQIRF